MLASFSVIFGGIYCDDPDPRRLEGENAASFCLLRSDRADSELDAARQTDSFSGNAEESIWSVMDELAGILEH